MLGDESSPIKTESKPKTNVKPAKVASRNYLAKGDKGAAVKAMQSKLVALGYGVGKAGVDGIFGKDSDKALRKFQADYGLAVDGKYGAQSKGALERAKPAKKRKATDKLAVDGYLARLTTSALQRYFKPPIEGVSRSLNRR